MKKALVLLIAAIGLASASQAVIINWAVSTPVSGTVEAELVYVASGTPAGSWGTLSSGTVIGSPVSGLAITPAGIGEQNSTDPTTQSGGNYYVVLFGYAPLLSGPSGSGNILLAYSSTPLAFNNGSDITSNPMAPATGVFDPGNNWTPIPEPCTMALLCVGAVTVAIRRRKKLCA